MKLYCGFIDRVGIKITNDIIIMKTIGNDIPIIKGKFFFIL